MRALASVSDAAAGEIELNFLETGSVTYLFGGKKTVVDAGRLSVFWAAIPHRASTGGLTG